MGTTAEAQDLETAILNKEETRVNAGHSFVEDRRSTRKFIARPKDQRDKQVQIFLVQRMALREHKDHRYLQPAQCLIAKLPGVQCEPYQLENLRQIVCLLCQKTHPSSKSRAVQARIYGYARKSQGGVILLGHHVGSQTGQTHAWRTQVRCRSVCSQQQVSQRCHQSDCRVEHAQTLKPSHFLRKSRGRTQ